MKTEFLNTQIQGLAKRSQNIISELGGIQHLLDFYDKHKSFISIPKAGRFTNEELVSFCNYLRSEEIAIKQCEFDKNKKLPDIYESIAIYENEKLLLSARLKNILNKLEYKYKYNSSIDNKIEYIRQFFFEKFDFLNISNLGLKSKLELESLKNKIFSSESTNEIRERAEFHKELYQSPKYSFPVYFNNKEKEGLFLNDMYSFKKMLCIFFTFYK